MYPECKKCARLKSSKRKSDNKKHYKKYDKIYYKKHKKLLNSRYKEKKLINGKKYRQSDRGKEKFKTYRKKRYEKKHEMYDIEWENCKKYFDYKCAYCGMPIEEHYFSYRDEMKLYDFHKEHIIDEGKNDLRNCVPACSSCNTQKHVKSLNNWYNTLDPNYTYKRYYKIYQWIRYDHKKYIMPKRRYKGQHMNMRMQEIKINKLKYKKLYSYK